MKVIYYNVSGWNMEILQFILDFLAKQGGESTLSRIIKLLKDNSFDLKKVLRELKPETVAPIIKQFLNSAPAAKVSASATQKSYGIAPIARVADKDIVYTLNKYLGS